MKAITCEVIMTGVSTRADGSLGMRMVTTELEAPEKLAILEAANQELILLIQPKSMKADGIMEVKGEFDRKTPSQRLRGVLYVKWKQEQMPMDWDDYYKKQMERFIDDIKMTLAPEQQ